MSTSFNNVHISCSALRQNYSVMKGKVAQTVALMAMVKADGYGHGMVKASECFGQAGCNYFGVAELQEGIELRKSGNEAEIFVTLGFIDDTCQELIEYNLRPVLYNRKQVYILNQIGAKENTVLSFHLKIDTGMSRLGVLVDELDEIIQEVHELRNVRIAGLMSHFPESDTPDKLSTNENFSLFKKVCSSIKRDSNVVCHIANSGAMFNFPSTSCDISRPGISLYGYHPAGTKGDKTILQPAMSFSTRILQVKTVPPGTGISYGYTYTTEKETKIAILPVGYEDGYSRSLSNKADVLIRGRRASIVGRICMNMCMVDVTHIADIDAGDEVILMGRQGNEVIDADELAEKANTISYEMLCSIGNNNNRIYIE